MADSDHECVRPARVHRHRPNKSDENAKLFSQYLESMGHGGHWLLGNVLSLAYFGGFVAWTLIAFDFPSLTGIGDFFRFALVDGTLFLLLALVYRLLLKRLLRKARRAGYPIQAPGGV